MCTSSRLWTSESNQPSPVNRVQKAEAHSERPRNQNAIQKRGLRLWPNLLYLQVLFTRRQQKIERILDFKSTRRFIEQRESERINKFDITAFVQTTVNLRIYQKRCHMNFMNKARFEAGHYRFAKRVVLDFINQVPRISSEHVSLEREKQFVRVTITTGKHPQ